MHRNSTLMLVVIAAVAILATAASAQPRGMGGHRGQGWGGPGGGDRGDRSCGPRGGGRHEGRRDRGNDYGGPPPQQGQYQEWGENAQWHEEYGGGGGGSDIASFLGGVGMGLGQGLAGALFQGGQDYGPPVYDEPQVPYGGPYVDLSQLHQCTPQEAAGWLATAVPTNAAAGVRSRVKVRTDIRTDIRNTNTWTGGNSTSSATAYGGDTYIIMAPGSQVPTVQRVPPKRDCPGD